MPIRKLTTHPQPDWSKTLDGYFISFARKAFRWSPEYRKALKRAFVEKREGVEYYRCEIGGEIIERSDKQVDHIIPVVPVGAVWNHSWDDYKKGLFVQAEGLHILCKSCHRKKTGAENRIRLKNNSSFAKMCSMGGAASAIKEGSAERARLAGKLRSQPVSAYYRYTRVGTFDSVNQASRVMLIHATNISKVLTGKRRSAGGFRFEYEKRK